MRKVFSFLVLAAVVLFTANCGGGGGNTPASITKSMYTQMQKGNFDKVFEIMMDNMNITAEQKQMLAAFMTPESLKEEMQKQGEIKSFDVTEVISEDGLSATVETKIVYKDGKEDSETTKWVKKDGRWVMSMGK